MGSLAEALPASKPGHRRAHQPMRGRDFPHEGRAEETDPDRAVNLAEHGHRGTGGWIHQPQDSPGLVGALSPRPAQGKPRTEVLATEQW